jgi:adenylosuccinate synthase
MPSELNDSEGDRLRECGQEYGTTTGRPRRCGWFDAVAGRYSIELNGCSSIALTRLDVLDTFEVIKVCIAYEINGERIDRFPSSRAAIAAAKPIWETIPGWLTSTNECRRFEDLPTAAMTYVRRIENLLGVPADIVGVGPERNEAIIVSPII